MAGLAPHQRKLRVRVGNGFLAEVHLEALGLHMRALEEGFLQQSEEDFEDDSRFRIQAPYRGIVVLDLQSIIIRAAGSVFRLKP